MLCQTCYLPGTDWMVCQDCRRSMRRAPDRILRGGVPVLAAFEHSGAARLLAHHLKYRGLSGYATLVAATLAPRVPEGPLVPVSRALSRRLRYGTDPSSMIASELSRLTGSPIVHLFKTVGHSRRRAGGDHHVAAPIPVVRKRTLEKVVLVDDVMTTGATLEAAVSAIGVRQVRAAVVANAVTGLSVRRSRPSGSAPQRLMRTRT